MAVTQLSTTRLDMADHPSAATREPQPPHGPAQSQALYPTTNRSPMVPNILYPKAQNSPKALYGKSRLNCCFRPSISGVLQNQDGPVMDHLSHLTGTVAGLLSRSLSCHSLKNSFYLVAASNRGRSKIRLRKGESLNFRWRLKKTEALIPNSRALF